MNYEKIYYNIINKALRKEISGQRYKNKNNYFKTHHIKPRSLGGSDNYIRNKFSTLPKWQYEKNLNNARKRWNQYHSGNYTCLQLACKDFNVSRIALHRMFLTYIPLYQKFKLNNKRPKFISDKSLINKYE